MNVLREYEKCLCACVCVRVCMRVWIVGVGVGGERERVRESQRGTKTAKILAVETWI